jgi:catechol 2,3-dioxygenase-like lactoylglutathione lyase family enzyme
MSAAAHLRGIDHVGLTVPDLETASRFLEEALGAIPLYDVQALDAPPMAGAQTEAQLGLPSGAKVVHMRLLRVGEGPSLELFQFADASQRDAAALPDFGLQHFALYVDDVDEAAARFEAAGGELLSPPNALAGAEAGPRNRWLYGRAPWGSLIELITYPDGVRAPESTPGRWTPPRQGGPEERIR